MDQQRFKKTRLLFDEAMQYPTGERDAFLDEACGPDTELRERIVRLLTYTDQDNDRTGEAGSKEESGTPILSVGGPAPDFDLPCISASAGRRRVALDDFRGQWSVLVFYPRDFSLICPTELTAMSNRIEDFRELGAEILAISVDTLDSHERWLTSPRSSGGLGGLSFDLASDEGGAVSRSYGVYLERQHVALRGIFIIDPNGVLQYGAVHNLSIGRRTEDVLRVLSALQTGGLCAEDWTPGLATLDPTEALRPGSVVSHYRIEECIGDGSCGSVFRAHDMTLDRTVALKVIKPRGPLAPGAILTEARAAAGLSHTNICTVYAVDEADGVPFIAMEYVEGQLLSKLIADAPLSAQHAGDIGHQLARGMAAAHSHGVVHGDLKPANVVVRSDGVVKILDFGLARAGRPPADREGTVTWGSGGPGGLRGTPAYMSPEQASGSRATRRSDVFSLGVIVYEMLTGLDAFPGPGIPEILSQVATTEPDRFAAAVAEPFATILCETLVRDAADRSITMDEIARRLDPGHTQRRPGP